MRLALTFLAVAAFAAQGQGGARGVHVWKSADITAKGKSLAQKLDAQKVASEVIAKEGNRRFMVAHREGSGIAEWHEKEEDVMLISAGNVTTAYGGTIVAAKTAHAGAMHGAATPAGE